MTPHSYNLQELNRMVANMIRVGTVEEIDASKAKVKIKFGDIITGWLPWCSARAGENILWHCPDVGEQVLCVAVAGDLNQARIVSSLYQDAYPQPSQDQDQILLKFKDGAEFKYHRENNALEIILPGGATTLLTSDGGITINGDVQINGDLDVDGDIAATGEVEDGTRKMSGDRTIYNGHTHPGVTSGGASTGPTTQDQ